MPTPSIGLALALVAVLRPLDVPGEIPSQREVLARAGEYVQRYAGQLPRLVATENTVQTADPLPGQSEPEVRLRRFVAEFAWAPLTPLEVLGFRDVIEVDGVRLTEERNRLAELLHGQSRGRWTDILALLDESARYNLAPGSRNFNLPTVTLFFLHPDMQNRFDWTRITRPESAEWTFEFEETERPTVIRTRDGLPAFSRGRVRVDAATGTVLQTELRLEIDKVDYWMRVRFAPVPRLGLTLPASLEEHYETPEHVVTGHSEYSNYRRFETRARLLK